jgi:hypothetical protein
MLNPDDRRWLSDLVQATIASGNRRNPPPELHDGTLLVTAGLAKQGIAVQLANSVTVYADNLTGQPLLLGERVMLFMNFQGAFIVGRWNAPNVPHTETARLTPGSISTASVTPVTIGAGCSVTISKYYDKTKLVVSHHATCYHSTSGAIGNFWVRITPNVTEQHLHTFYHNALNPFHTQTSSVVTLAQTYGTAAVGAADTYTIELRWATSAANLQMDSNDTVEMSVTETM